MSGAALRSGLYPFPVGWYCMASDRELTHPTRAQWCGRLLQVQPGPDGYAVHADDGRPVHTTHQQQALFLWHDPAGGPPAWRMPVPPEDGWTAYQFHRWGGLNSHPQETSENSVDLAHFSLVHGYQSVEVEEPATTDGPCLTAAYGIRRTLIPGLDRPTLRIGFRLQAWGLGYSFVETVVPNIGLHVRNMVYATPVDGERIDLRVAWSARSPGLGSLADKLVLAAIRATYVPDVQADLHIWENKRYLDKPVVVRGDGPIHLYRKWARQFTPVEARQSVPSKSRASAGSRRVRSRASSGLSEAAT